MLRDASGESIGLRKEDVEPHRPGFRQGLENLSVEVPGPPLELPQLGETPLVDIHDDDPGRARARG